MKSSELEAKEAKEKAEKEAKRLTRKRAKIAAEETRKAKKAEEKAKKEVKRLAKERAKIETEEAQKARKIEEKAKKESERAAKEMAQKEAIEARERAKREAEETRQAREAIEAELIENLKSGDPEAVAQMYNTHINRVYSLVFNQLDKNHEATQEIVQETFLAAVKSVKYFHGRSSIFTWLCSIANRKVADFYRRKKRQTKYQVDYSIDIEQLQDRGETVASLVESGESSEVIRQALFSLPLHYQQVLIMKYVEEIPVSEIGEIMGRSQKSVEGLLTRARKEMQAKLAT